MGKQWLKQVENALRNAGFRVEQGYPAHKAAALSDTVAAVNLAAMDERSVREVLVTVLTPREHGLAQCQNRAVDALAVLAADGNRWDFSRWRYEAGIDCWAIEIHGKREAGAGLSVLIDGKVQEDVTDFLAQQALDRRLIYPHGHGTPSGVIPGKKGWILKLTQLCREEEPDLQTQEPFQITLRRGNIQQVYTECFWKSYSSRLKPEGIEVIRDMYALDREVSAVEQDAV